MTLRSVLYGGWRGHGKSIWKNARKACYVYAPPHQLIKTISHPSVRNKQLLSRCWGVSVATKTVADMHFAMVNTERFCVFRRGRYVYKSQASFSWDTLFLGIYHRAELKMGKNSFQLMFFLLAFLWLSSGLSEELLRVIEIFTARLSFFSQDVWQYISLTFLTKSVGDYDGWRPH